MFYLIKKQETIIVLFKMIQMMNNYNLIILNNKIKNSKNKIYLHKNSKNNKIMNIKYILQK